ncbi:hypothetical protein C8R48DRAFT_737816 [Suillus tomentosus]|nr:hypothetical protein C8R48DRAFT_737816 [Suillus tomentosus]
MSLYLQSTQLPSSSRSGPAPDQDSLRSSLQSCLEYIDRVHDRLDHDRLDCVCKEMLEIRIRLTELLVTQCQAEIIMRDEGTSDNGIDFQAIIDDSEPQTIVPLATLDELNAVSPSLTPSDLPVLAESQTFQGQPSTLEYGPLGFTSTLPEGLPISRLPQDLLLSGSYRLDFSPQYDTYFYRKMMSESESSASCDQQSSHPIQVALADQDKVKCTWSGCSKALKKGSLTRHINETHRRKVKAVCVPCGKRFARPYMLKNHVCRAERGKS